MLNPITVVAYDFEDTPMEDEPDVLVEVHAKTPADALKIKKNLMRLIKGGPYMRVEVEMRDHKNNFVAANLRYTDRTARAKHPTMVSEEDYNSDYYSWCEKIENKYARADKRKAFLAKIERGFEVSQTAAQISFTDWIARRIIRESEIEKALEFAKDAAAESDVEFKLEPHDDEEIPF